jgi:integrase
MPIAAISGQSTPKTDRELIDGFGVKKMAEKRRNSKGAVAVGVDRGWLRLIWSYQGKRYTLALGLPDDQTNRAIAEAKAALIYRDIVSDHFDISLNKYKSLSQSESQSIAVVGLFEQWLKYKAKQVEAISLEKQRSFFGYLQQFFKNKNASLVSEEEAFGFRDWLLKRNKPITVRERIGWLRSCWRWALKRKLIVGENPWNDVQVKVPPAQKQPFTKGEVAKILKGFEAAEFAHYRHYAEFLLSITSVRDKEGWNRYS